MSNKEAYKNKSIVDHYSYENNLQLPEKNILEILKNQLPEMKMLDIGVGAGRTTLHFAKLAKQYIGVDYSEEMISACKMRFAEASDNISFQVCDVRAMEAFEDNSFDFILFSFNGIDSISHEDREKAFREIQRVGKPGSYFCFSTHNLNSTSEIFNFSKQFDCPPWKIFKKIVKWIMLKFVYNNYKDIRNLKHSQFAIITDGAHLFKIKNHYIRPIEQIRQIQKGFEDIRIFSLSTGKEIKTDSELKSIKDPWLYYFCLLK